jgi:PKHD-type hydroxylase
MKSFKREYVYAPGYIDIFSVSEINEILRIVEKFPLVSGTTSSSEEDQRTIRRSKVSWIENDTDTNWIYKKVSNAIIGFNSDHYKFSILGIEPIQYTTYDEDDYGTYDFHIDSMITSNGLRKISVSVLLSEPDSYVGGDLVLSQSGGGDLWIPPRVLGRAIVFPSWVPHKVTPVTKGIRKVLVFWVYGEPFV